MAEPTGPERPLTVADLTEILELLRKHGWREAHLRHGDFELSLSHNADGAAEAIRADDAVAAPAPTGPVPATPGGSPASATPEGSPVPAAPTGSVTPVDPALGGKVITAESLGVFWRSPQPGAPPFVEIGDEVTPTTPLCIVEVMKLMTRVEAGIAGRVAAIHVENGEMVEYGQPLMTIVPL